MAKQEQREIAINFQTNVSSTIDQLRNLQSTLDESSSEYSELTLRIEETEQALKDYDTLLESNIATEKQLLQSKKKLQQQFANNEKVIQKNTTATKGLTSEITSNGGAMAILDTITGGLASTTRDALEATTLFTTGTNLSSVAQRAYTFVVGTSTGALRVFKIALAATGIGAALVLVGFLVEAYMSLSSATDEATESQRKLNAEMANNQYEETLSRMEYLTEVRRAQAQEQVLP